MFNPLNLITKFIKSSNQKELDRIGKIVKTINSLEDEFKKLDDLDFPKKTQEYKEQIKQGKTLDELLPQAFALVREASLTNANACGKSSSKVFPCLICSLYSWVFFGKSKSSSFLNSSSSEFIVFTILPILSNSF